jgi:hypothetical protein
LDPRGLKGRGKGARKQDVLITCSRSITILKEKKQELLEQDRASKIDYREKYREFLPRGLTKDLAHGPLSTKTLGKKANNR